MSGSREIYFQICKLKVRSLNLLIGFVSVGAKAVAFKSSKHSLKNAEACHDKKTDQENKKEAAEEEKKIWIGIT